MKHSTLTDTNLAAVERAVAGVRWYRGDSPLAVVKAKMLGWRNVTKFEAAMRSDMDRR